MVLAVFALLAARAGRQEAERYGSRDGECRGLARERGPLQREASADELLASRFPNVSAPVAADGKLPRRSPRCEERSALGLEAERTWRRPTSWQLVATKLTSWQLVATRIARPPPGGV